MKTKKANQKAVTIKLADFVTWYTGEDFTTAGAREIWADADLPENVFNMPADTLIKAQQMADDYHAYFYCLLIIIDGAEYFADAVESMPF